MKIFNSIFLGTTRRLKNIKTGCLFTFHYRAKDGTDPTPFIIMLGPKWSAKKGGTYISGVNLNVINEESRNEIISQFGNLPVGSVSYNDIKSVAGQDPACCVRTYNTIKIRALHKVEPDLV